MDGDAIATKTVMALCRCGGSKNCPFCDGTHATVGFEDSNDGALERDERKSYRGELITIHDNRGICSHAAICTERFSSVFKHKQQLWIDPDNAEVSEIVEIIEACPSGALSYSFDGVEHRDLYGDPAIAIEKHGPFRVKGRVELEDALWFRDVARDHYTLCRCGSSKNKPFCNGAH